MQGQTQTTMSGTTAGAHRVSGWLRAAGGLTLAVLGLLAGCGGGDATATTGANAASSPGGGVSSQGGPLGLYRTWEQGSTTVYNTVCGVDGFCSNYPSTLSTFEYKYLFFNNNGYVHVGLADDPRALTCPRGSASSEDCQRYTLQGGQITIGTQAPVRYAFSSDGTLTMGGYDHEFTPVPPAPKGFRFEGVFKNTSCSGSTCSRTTYGFSRDGTVWMVGSSTLFAGIGNGTVSGGSSRDFEGRYDIDGYTVTFTAANGASVSSFLGLSLEDQSPDIQIGGTIYSKDTGD